MSKRAASAPAFDELRSVGSAQGVSGYITLAPSIPCSSSRQICVSPRCAWPATLWSAGDAEPNPIPPSKFIFARPTSEQAD